MNVDDHLSLWAKREPWFYSPQVFNRNTYALISGAILSGVIGSLIYFDGNLLACLIGYFLAQFIFGFGHMTTHALYAESPMEDWEPGVLVAYLHHYVDPGAIYKLWLNHRLNFLMQSKGCAVAYIGAWVLPALLFGAKITPVYCWYLFWFAMIEPVHEWYHVPKELRKVQFSKPLYWWLTFLNKVGAIDENQHKVHHGHKADKPDSVKGFSDLYFPFLDSFLDWIWSNAVSRRFAGKSTKEPMRRRVYLQGLFFIPLTFSLTSYLFFVIY